MPIKSLTGRGVIRISGYILIKTPLISSTESVVSIDHANHKLQINFANKRLV